LSSSNASKFILLVLLLGGSRLEARPVLRLRHHWREQEQRRIAWQPWSPAALEQARKANKPILLDIGARWSRRSHEMESRSYEDVSVARLVRNYYVPIRVDFDRRPDVARRYERVLRWLLGQAKLHGLRPLTPPITMFLTRGGESVIGCTYLPHERRGEFPSLRDALLAGHKAHRKKPKKIRRQVDQLEEEARAEEFSFLITLRRRPADLLAALAQEAEQYYDQRFGGFGRAPKLALPLCLQGLLLQHHRRPSEPGGRMLWRTLDGVLRGAGRDQLGGGFHHGSTDRRWKVPFFGKRLGHNATMLSLLVRAFQVTGEARYRVAAEETLDYVRRVLADEKRGGFFASQDAVGARGRIGDYYTFTLFDVNKALDGDEYRVARQFFDIHTRGDLDDQEYANALFIARTVEGVAQAMGRPIPEIRRLLSGAKAKLLAQREGRPPPELDRTLFVDQNAAMISAFLEAGIVLERKEATRFALFSLDRLWRECYAPEKGMCHYLDAPTSGDDVRPTLYGLLDDQALTVHALLDAYEVTGDAHYVTRARALAGLMFHRLWYRFFDGQLAAFRDAVTSPTDPGELKRVLIPVEDRELLGGNASAIMAFDRLSFFEDRPPDRRLAGMTLRCVVGQVTRHGPFAAGLALAAEYHLQSPLQLVIVGRREAPETQALHRAALRIFPLDRVVRLLDPALVRHPRFPPRPDGRPLAYVVPQQGELQRAETPAQLREWVEQLRPRTLSTPKDVRSDANPGD